MESLMNNHSYVEAVSGTKVDFLSPSLLPSPNIGGAKRSIHVCVYQVCASVVSANVPEINMLAS